MKKENDIPQLNGVEIVQKTELDMIVSGSIEVYGIRVPNYEHRDPKPRGDL